MASQSDIDQITGQVQAVEQHVTDAQTALQSELDALQAQIDAGTAAAALDLSGLQAAVSQLDPAVTALGALKPDQAAAPQQPAPEPAPAPEQPSQPAPAPAQPAPSEPDKTVYTFSGDPSQIDPAAWPASGFATDSADGSASQPLYYFSGDTAAGQANGNGLSGGAWQAYTGPVKAA